MNRVTRIALSVLGIGVVLAAVFWAGTVVANRAPTSESDLNQSPVDVEVIEQRIGKSFSYSTTINRASLALAANLRPGVLTAMGDATDGSFSTGDKLYAIDGNWTILAEGDTPFYRSLGPGDRGADVSQVQRMLIAKGHLSGEADGQYGPRTAAASSRFQKAEGLPVTGSWERGSLVAAPSLPSALLPNAETAVIGSLVSEGAGIFLRPAADPSFVMTLSPSQAAAIPQDADITVRYGEYAWDAAIADVTQDNQSGASKLKLTAPDGSVVCGSECGVLPLQETTTVESTVLITPETQGPAVPLAALSIQPDGSATVTRIGTNGEEQLSVRVLASGQGVAIVDGLNIGDTVRLLDPAREAE